MRDVTCDNRLTFTAGLSHQAWDLIRCPVKQIASPTQGGLLGVYALLRRTRGAVHVFGTERVFLAGNISRDAIPRATSAEVGSRRAIFTMTIPSSSGRSKG